VINVPLSKPPRDAGAKGGGSIARVSGRIAAWHGMAAIKHARKTPSVGVRWNLEVVVAPLGIIAWEKDSKKSKRCPWRQRPK